MKIAKWLATALVGAGLAGAAQASLLNLGNGTIKDTATNLIWLQDWNVNGIQDWATQKAWAEGLTFAGSSDWLLPEIGQYQTLLADVGGLSALMSTFSNVVENVYWSNTDDAADPTKAFIYLVHFSSFGNTQSKSFVGDYAVAVRSDSVTVPEPTSGALIGLGLAGFAAYRSRKKLSSSLSLFVRRPMAQ